MKEPIEQLLKDVKRDLAGLAGYQASDNDFERGYRAGQVLALAIVKDKLQEILTTGKCTSMFLDDREVEQ